MNYMPSIFAAKRTTFTNLDITNLTRTKKENGNAIAYFETEAVDGTGRYEFSDDTFQEGEFENERFVRGTYNLKNVIYRGDFTFNENDGLEYLNDENGEIEYTKSGIVYQGCVTDDVPAPEGGVYVVPSGTTCKHNKYEGVLTYEAKKWVCRFQEGPVKELVGTNFDIFKMRFDDPKTIVFRDGCTYVGTEYATKNDSFDDTFTASVGTNTKLWTTYQLNLWLIVNTKNIDIGDEFFDWIHEYNVTGSQFGKFTDAHYEYIGADLIQALQIREAFGNVQ